MTPPARRDLEVQAERWPLLEPFSIARGTVTEVTVVTVRISEDPPEERATGAHLGRHIGWGECRPYARYGETPASVVSRIHAVANDIAAGMSREELAAWIEPGAARNAVDAALLDLESKLTGTPPWTLLGLAPPTPVTTAFTISLASPEAMGLAAGRVRTRPILKLKLGGPDGGGDLDLARVRAVRDAAPDATLLVDANEGFDPEGLPSLLRALAGLGVTLVEQPLPAGHDQALAAIERPLVVCADESMHTRADLPALRDRYDAVNIKLDKTGGPTEARHTIAEARRLGLRVMVGCMVSTSLAVRPASWLARDADWVDLDAPLLLARDRERPVRYEGSILLPDRHDPNRRAS